MKKPAIIIAALAIGADVAFAQPAPEAPAAAPSKLTKVENWSIKQWNSARREWAKDRVRWADWRQQSAKEKLTGRKSWSFLYTCMTTKS